MSVYGTYLGLRELFKSNVTKIREAYKEMQGCVRDMERAEADTAWAESAVWEVHVQLWFYFLNLSGVLYISIFESVFFFPYRYKLKTFRN